MNTRTQVSVNEAGHVVSSVIIYSSDSLDILPQGYIDITSHPDRGDILARRKRWNGSSFEDMPPSNSAPEVSDHALLGAIARKLGVQV